MFVIDCAQDYSLQALKLKSLGASGVMRYFNPLSNGKDSGKSLTAAEAHRWAGYGMPIGIVVEGYGLANGTGVDDPSGTRDAREVLAWLPTVGLTPSPLLVVYFAVDTDATTAQINDNEVAYFNAIGSVFNAQPLASRPQIGVYGSGATCLAMVGTKRAAKAWVAGSTGWTGYASYVAANGWTLLQKIYPGEMWNGFHADTNTVNGSLISAGLQVPFALSAPTITKVAPTPSMNPPGNVTPAAPSKSIFGSFIDSFRKM